MNKLTQLCLFLLLIGCNTKSKSKKFDNSEAVPDYIIGFFEYQASGLDRNQYILIDTLQNNVYGLYYRTEPKRGKGQWYYANSLSDLRIDKRRINFKLGDRKLFSSRPVSPGKRSMNLPTENGREESKSLQFTGRYTDSGLELECTSPDSDCPAKSMVFKRIPLPD